MTDRKPAASIRLELTAEQREKIRQLTGKDAAQLELTAEELEQRIAPKIVLN